MANILYLVHRLPYPPNKGDKVRSYHLLKHLARHHRVYLGTFIDDPDDERTSRPCAPFAPICMSAGLNPGGQNAQPDGLLDRRAADVTLLPHRRLRTGWTNLSRRHIDAAVIFSSAMAQYVEGCSASRP